ncbi:MAG: hypothetical protein NXH75_10785 [Halobacteriovoraceae bacterium]|nr:hypothetical protein [Halobacteriovoraceae bacterium]
MKIYPDLQKVWAKRIRDAGMTSNQAKKILKESEKTVEVSKLVAESGGEIKPEEIVQRLLRKINIF